ncbi:MAG TPA: hypothetical protein VF544_14405 [Pyrinomonadaceae bacterium]|jgi:hypothetical protein
MSEHGDNTTEPDAPSPEHGAPRPAGSYYYDDATGYEIYDPLQEEEEEEEDKPAQGEHEIDG